MRPYVEELSKIAGDTFISCYPNAGLPNPMSDTGFDETRITGGHVEGVRQGGLPGTSPGAAAGPRPITSRPLRVG